MKNADIKMKVASFVTGVVGAFWIISALVAFSSVPLQKGMFEIGVGLGLISIALEPSVLFRPLNLSEARRPRPPMAVALSVVGGILMVLAGLIWLASAALMANEQG
jgi:hypothetical protein